MESLPLGPTYLKRFLEDEGAMSANVALVSDLFRSIANTLEQRMMSMPHYFASTPFGLVLLISSDPQDVDMCLS